MALLERIKIILRSPRTGNQLPVFINVENSSLGRKWLTSLNHLLANNYHLEKNYCFFGFVNSPRDGQYILNQINQSIQSINQTFPLIESLLTSLSIDIPIISVDEFSKRSNSHQPSTELKVLFDQYGSDKASKHNYHLIYGTVLSEKFAIKNILEVGMGTNNLDVASNMGKLGKPGASLRAFRDFCVNAEIYGADIDRRIIKQDEKRTGFGLFPEWFIETCKRIEDYMNSEGYKTLVSVRYPTDWVNLDIDELEEQTGLIQKVKLEFESLS